MDGSAGGAQREANAVAAHPIKVLGELGLGDETVAVAINLLNATFIKFRSPNSFLLAQLQG